MLQKAIRIFGVTLTHANMHESTRGVRYRSNLIQIDLHINNEVVHALRVYNEWLREPATVLRGRVENNAMNLGVASRANKQMHA